MPRWRSPSIRPSCWRSPSDSWRKRDGSAGSAAQLVRGGGAQLLELADARRADPEQAVDMAALEEIDAQRLADRHRLLAVAAAHDRAGAAEAGDQLAELIALGLAAAAQHVGVPHDLDEIEAETLAVDERQGEIGDAVETDAIAALLDEVAGEEIGAEIGEDVDRLQLEDDSAARLRPKIGVEGEEAVGEQRRDVEIDAEAAGDGAVVVLHQELQHAQIERLRQMLEEPAVAGDVVARHDDGAQLVDRDVELAEHRLRRRIRGDRADRLAPHHVGEVGARDRVDQLAEAVRAERRQLGRLAGLARAADRGEAAIALLVLVVERLGDGEELVILPLQIVPRAEAAFLVLVDILGQGIVVEEMAQAHHRLVDRRDVGALADEDQIGIAEGEDLPVHLLDEELEGIDGDADVVAASVIGAQLRELDVDGPPSGAEFRQALGELE